MIENEKEYQSTKKALEHLEKSLTGLHIELYNSSPERYFVLAEPYLDYIKKLRYEIDSYIGIISAEEKSVPLWIRLKGPQIGEGNISFVLLSNFLENFKLSIKRVAEFLSEETLLKVGRPKEELRSLYDFNIKMLPGSVRVGISFPSHYEQKTISGESIENPVEGAVKKIIKGASWAVGLEDKEIEDIFPKEEERHLILTQIDKLTQSVDGKISTIELKGKYTPKGSIILTKNVRNRIKKVIEKSIPPEKVIEIGVMREIDLDKRHFYLRERPNIKEELHCEYEELLQEDSKAGLDKKVRVIGELYIDKFKKQRSLKVEKIDIINQENND